MDFKDKICYNLCRIFSTTMIADLVKLGLTEEEAKIYLSCLEIGGGAVSTIAKKAEVNRVTCYHTLDNLLKKGYLSQYNKNGIRCFSPEPPEQLLKIAEEQVNITKGLIPQLASLTSTLAFKPKVRFYEGREGVEKVFLESLEAKKEILGYTNLKRVIEFFPAFFKKYTHDKMEKGIKTRYLSPKTVESVHVIDPYLPANYNQDLLEIFLVNKDQFPFDNEILIFEHLVCIVSLEPSELLGLIVESSTFARTMKAIFDLAWIGATSFIIK